jgi:hypothetical protein
MKYLFIISLLCSCFVTSGQKWHSIKEHLKYYTPIGLHGYVAGIKHVDRYDTVAILYKRKDDTLIYLGNKFVFVYKGQFTDDNRTYMVVYNNRFRMVTDVEKYCFIK